MSKKEKLIKKLKEGGGIIMKNTMEYKDMRF